MRFFTRARTTMLITWFYICRFGCRNWNPAHHPSAFKTDLSTESPLKVRVKKGTYIQVCLIAGITVSEVSLETSI